MKFNVNTYSVIGNGLEQTINLYGEVLKAMRKLDSTSVSVWPFNTISRDQLAKTGFFLKGTKGDVDSILSMVSVDHQVQPVVS